MDRSKLEVYGKEFPFLVEDEGIKEFIREHPHATISVQLTDSDLLQTISSDYNLIVFFDKNRKRIGRVGIEKEEWEHGDFLFWRKTRKKISFLPERVEEAIARLDPDGKEVFYIFMGNSGGRVPSVVIYKPPKDFSLGLWLKTLHDFHRHVLEEELRIIDVKAEQIKA